jgi:hypothetical protein
VFPFESGSRHQTKACKIVLLSSAGARSRGAALAAEDSEAAITAAR